MRRRSRAANTRDYKLARYEYVRIRREEERNYEKDIIEKCGEEPRLFYRYINKKLKHRECIDRLRDDHRIYEEPKEMSELLNLNFQKVFTE